MGLNQSKKNRESKNSLIFAMDVFHYKSNKLLDKNDASRKLSNEQKIVVLYIVQ